jgi:hypothetical protein
MDKSANLPRVPEINDFQSRQGIRGSAQALYRYQFELRRKLEELFNKILAEINTLYGEVGYTAGAPANGAQTVLTVTAPGAIPGQAVSVTYDQDLQGLGLSAYVSAPDTVKIILSNNTGGAVSLANGKFRVYVLPRMLT